MPKLTIFGFFSNNFTDRGYETRLTQFFLFINQKTIYIQEKQDVLYVGH